MSTTQDTLISTLYVSTVHISLARNSSKTIESIRLRKNDKSLRDVQKIVRAGDVHREEFCPPLAINLGDRVFVSVNCSSRLSKRVDIDVSLRDIEYMRDEQGVRSYRKTAKNVQVVVTGHHTACGLPSIYTLPSCISPVARDYKSDHPVLFTNPNFGHREWVGKSSLIRRVFGVESVHTSEITHGIADIDREFISPTDERFVVHDSLGFEACDERNVDIVKQFIARRKAMPRVKDQLHAIWLCLEIPYAGGRLLEAGVERFLRRRDEILGKVPLVVVLTKVDLLDTQLELDLATNETLEHYKSRYLNEDLVRPLRDAAGSDVTYVAVSVGHDYSESLSNLVKATDKNLVKYLVDEVPQVVGSNMGYLQGSYRLQLDSFPNGPAVGMSGFPQFQAA